MGPSTKRNPAHPVILTKGFYLGKYEVTQEQYQKVMRANPSKFKGTNLPVEMVKGEEARMFCEALKQKGKNNSRMDIYSTNRSTMGVCLSCRYDHGIFMG